MTRGADAVGAGLAPARAARPIRNGERIHLVGIAGAGASAAALHAAWAGAAVSGCDPGGPSPYTAALATNPIEIAWEHDPGHVTGPLRPDRLAVTKALTAIDPDHPELRAARSLGVTLEPWQQVVADAASGRLLVGVAGTHGKSTSAAWLVHVLATAGLDPAAFVGALLPPSITGEGPATARRGDGPHFVVEADEYAGNFDPYRPATALLTNLEWDHPDVFADRAAVIDALEGWVRRMPVTALRPMLVANVGDPGAAELAARLADWPGHLAATMLLEAADGERDAAAGRLADRFRTAAGPARVVIGRILASDSASTTLEIGGWADGVAPLVVRLPTAGRHNAANALGVAATAIQLGVAPEVAAAALASFPGVGRRLERIGTARGVVIYDDYGHHPTAIRETLLALRQLEPDRRLWAVYEPLTYHRTAAMLDAFAEVLVAADAVVIAEIWAGRDPDRTVASAGGLAAAVRAARPGIMAVAPGTVEETAAWLAGHVAEGDVVLVMGGGRSYLIGRLLLASPGEPMNLATPPLIQARPAILAGRDAAAQPRPPR